MKFWKKEDIGNSVFISYRRSTGRDVARNLYERLSMNGINTFFDYSSIREGKFNEQIFAAIEHAKDFILVLSQNALDKCNQEDDWVRIEIEYALAHKKNIILVSTQENITFPGNLPLTLSELPHYQAVTLSQEYYDESIKRIIGRLSCNPFPVKRLIGGLVIGVAVVIMGIISYNACYKHVLSSKISNSDFTVRLYLPRYDDINREILSMAFFEEKNLRAFSYEDTIINEKYVIYPKSTLITSPYSNYISVHEDDSLKLHNLPIRVRIYNPKSKTVIINKAVIQLYDIRPLTHLSVSVLKSDKGLIIRNEDRFTMPQYKLRYSSLKPNESFVDYKNEVVISSREYEIIPASENLHVKGRIEYNGLYWNFDTQTSEYNTSESNSYSSINPATSDYFVSLCEIPSWRENQEFALTDFTRKLVKGEVDENIFLIIKSHYNFIANMKITLTTIDNQEICSDSIKIIYVYSDNYKYEPF